MSKKELEKEIENLKTTIEHLNSLIKEKDAWIQHLQNEVNNKLNTLIQNEVNNKLNTLIQNQPPLECKHEGLYWNTNNSSISTFILCPKCGQYVNVLPNTFTTTTGEISILSL